MTQHRIKTNGMTHHHIETNGVTLHVVEMGEGPVVLFVHGFPDTWRGWRRQMEAVVAAGYRAVALDMRGYGESSTPDDASLYTIFYSVGDLIGVLDFLAVNSAVVVGHDFGAAIALVNRVAEAAEAANHHPDILVHGWNEVRLTLSTHSVRGLTSADLDLAHTIDGLA